LLLNKWEPEYRFHPVRKWRFDWAMPSKKVAVEFEGGVAIKGRHTRIIGYTKDCEKYNAAALLGWKVLRYTALSKINNAIVEIEEAINEKIS
jgi:very-short-patch-repair endonuclease